MNEQDAIIHVYSCTDSVSPECSSSTLFNTIPPARPGVDGAEYRALPVNLSKALSSRSGSFPDVTGACICRYSLSGGGRYQQVSDHHISRIRRGSRMSVVYV